MLAGGYPANTAQHDRYEFTWVSRLALHERRCYLKQEAGCGNLRPVNSLFTFHDHFLDRSAWCST